MILVVVVATTIRKVRHDHSHAHRIQRVEGNQSHASSIGENMSAVKAE
jgi:hypothetical protein